jgi:hypothetical protein
MNPIDRAGDAARSVGGYISNLAREARDIPTAIGTVYKNRQSGINEKRAEFNFGDREDIGDTKNLRTQIAEVGKAALTGKKGTTSQKSTVIEEYTPGKTMGTYTDMPKQRK